MILMTVVTDGMLIRRMKKVHTLQPIILDLSGKTRGGTKAIGPNRNGLYMIGANRKKQLTLEPTPNKQLPRQTMSMEKRMNEPHLV